MNIFRTLPSQYWAVCFAAGDLLADVHVRRDVHNLDPKPQPLPIGQAQQLTLCLVSPPQARTPMHKPFHKPPQQFFFHK